jgi:hypothetical protein
MAVRNGETHRNAGVATLSDITGYEADNDFAIGTYVDGYFLLDFATHRLDTWKSEDEWKRAVSARTSLTTSWLRNPKGRFNQTREPVVLDVYLAIMGVALVFSLCRCGCRRSACNTTDQETAPR